MFSQQTSFRFSLNKKWMRWTAGIVLCCATLLLALSWLLPALFKKQISKKIETSVKNASKGLYKVTYENISINLLTRSASVTHLRLTPDSATYNQKIEIREAPQLLADLKLKSLDVNGISFFDFLLRREITVNQILMLEPDLKLTIQKEGKVKNEPPKSPGAMIDKIAKSIRIDNIRIQKGNFLLTNVNKEDTSVSKICNLTVGIDDFFLDKNAESDTNKILFSKHIGIQSDSIQLALKDPMYQLSVTGLRLSSTDSTLKINTLHLNPLYSKASFGKIVQLAKDRLDFNYATISSKNVDVRRLLTKREFVARSLSIGKGNMDVYKDKRYPKYITNRMGTYPHQLLLKTDLKIKLDTIRLKNTRVIYGEFSDKTYQRGKIHFEDVHGIITNVTNDSTTISQNNHMVINVETRFMGKGKLRAYFDFDLASKKGDFGCGGKMEHFEMKEVNEMIRSLAKANVKSGKLTLLNFDIKGDDYNSYIRMQMHYNDLKIEVLKLDEESGEFKKRSFISNLLNNIIIDNNNPKGDKPARIGEATLTRESTQPFFNLVWLTIQEPIKRIVTGKDDRGKAPK